MFVVVFAFASYHFMLLSAVHSPFDRSLFGFLRFVGVFFFLVLDFTKESFEFCLSSYRFRPAYKAFRNDSSFNFMVFFFIYFFQSIFTVFQAIGVPDSGYCGFIIAIKQFHSNASDIIVGILLLCIAFCFAFTAAVNIFMITKVSPL